MLETTRQQQAAAGARPSPHIFLEALRGYQRTAAVKSAVELDVFTAIGEGINTVDALAVRCEASERGVRILCDYLVAAGLLLKHGECYALTADSSFFLDRRSPNCIASVADFFAAPLLMESYKDFTQAVRTGGTVTGGIGTLSPDHPIWPTFARSMRPLVRMLAIQVAKFLDQRLPDAMGNVLELGAGHGMFGIALARQNPRVSITAVDWPSVLDIAMENAATAGVADRYHLLPGDAFAVDYGSEYDLVLLGNFLHHFAPAVIERLLRKVFNAVRVDGRVAVIDYVLNEDRTSPPAAAGSALALLATTPSGQSYTFAEYDGMFRKAGFRQSEIYSFSPTPESLVIACK